MSLHLFSTPIECTNCGTVVDDPKVDRCPSCGKLLKERRTPSRLAGVEKRYGNFRFLLGTLQFLGVIVLVVGSLAFFFTLGDEAVPITTRLTLLLGSILLAVGLFTIVALFQVVLDLEENTRAAFRLQQLMLDSVEGWIGDHGAVPREEPESVQP
jgi:predicted RNA-binding Zn-ribbon protein involved in translation (DUF1610 family)